MPTAFLDTLRTAPSVAELPPTGSRLIIALRLFVIARRRGHCPLARLTERLGSSADARLAIHVAGIVGYLWPERFTVSPPCCTSLSFDEQLLAELACHVADGDRPAYDRASRELLNEDARDQLWRELNRWGMKPEPMEPPLAQRWLAHRSPPPHG
jgi:hypothetical protein